MGFRFFYAEISGPTTGTANDDYMYGTDGNDWYSGLGGNDTIRGNAGADTLDGDDGNDTLEGGSGNDYLNGGNGIDTASFFNTNHGVIANLEFGTSKTLGAGPVDNDTLNSIENLTGSFYDDYFQGTEGSNRLEGMAGNDVLLGWGGGDTLQGGFGIDYVMGGEGNDNLSGGFGNDYIDGGNGFDYADYSYAYAGMFVNLAQNSSHDITPNGSPDSDNLYNIEGVIGSAYNDVLIGDAAENTLKGAGGDDTLDGGAGGDVLAGGDGIDTVTFATSSNSVGLNLALGWGQLGDASGDTYLNIENIIGSDYFAGDVLTGSDGDNRIDGIGGNDVIKGLGGNDTITGGWGIDFIDGGAGNDTINGGDGGDKLDGGDGIDIVNFNPSFGGIGPEGPGVTVDLTAGTVSGLGNDGETVANFEVVIATPFDDIITGNAVANLIMAGGNQDQISGRGGNDVLYGDWGNDTISGGAGADIISGGAGRDIMTGDGGADRFVFTAYTETGTTGPTRDIIQDFTKGQDTISLSLIDASTLAAGNQAFSFIDNDAFTGVAGQLHAVSQGVNTLVEGDVNGDSVADFQILLTGQIDLSALDFIL